MTFADCPLRRSFVRLLSLQNTPVIGPVRHLEPSDSNSFLDPDNALSLHPDGHAQPHLSNIDCSPQIVNKQLDEAKAKENQQPIEEYAYEQESKPTINIDVLHSNTIISARRRTKRRLLNRSGQFDRQLSEDDEPNALQHFSSFKRRSRTRKRDSTPVTTGSNGGATLASHHDGQRRSSVALLRKRSASENDIPLFQFDFEPIPFVDAPSRLNSIDQRPKSLNLCSAESVPANLSLVDDGPNSNFASNTIIIEQSNDSTNADDSLDVLDSSLLSQSAPLVIGTASTVRISQSDERTSDFYAHADYSPSSSYQR